MKKGRWRMREGMKEEGGRMKEDEGRMKKGREGG